MKKVMPVVAGNSYSAGDGDPRSAMGRGNFMARMQAVAAGRFRAGEQQQQQQQQQQSDVQEQEIVDCAADHISRHYSALEQEITEQPSTDTVGAVAPSQSYPSYTNEGTGQEEEEEDDHDADYIPESLAEFIEAANKRLQETKDDILAATPATSKEDRSWEMGGADEFQHQQQGPPVLVEDEEDRSLKREVMTRIDTSHQQRKQRQKIQHLDEQQQKLEHVQREQTEAINAMKTNYFSSPDFVSPPPRNPVADMTDSQVKRSALGSNDNAEKLALQTDLIQQQMDYVATTSTPSWLEDFRQPVKVGERGDTMSPRYDADDEKGGEEEVAFDDSPLAPVPPASESIQRPLPVDTTLEDETEDQIPSPSPLSMSSPRHPTAAVMERPPAPKPEMKMDTPSSTAVVVPPGTPSAVPPFAVTLSSVPSAKDVLAKMEEDLAKMEEELAADSDNTSPKSITVVPPISKSPASAERSPAVPSKLQAASSLPIPSPQQKTVSQTLIEKARSPRFSKSKGSRFAAALSWVGGSRAPRTSVDSKPNDGSAAYPSSDEFSGGKEKMKEKHIKETVESDVRRSPQIPVPSTPPPEDQISGQVTPASTPSPLSMGSPGRFEPEEMEGLHLPSFQQNAMSPMVTGVSYSKRNGPHGPSNGKRKPLPSSGHRQNAQGKKTSQSTPDFEYRIEKSEWTPPPSRSTPIKFSAATADRLSQPKPCRPPAMQRPKADAMKTEKTPGLFTTTSAERVSKPTRSTPSHSPKPPISTSASAQKSPGRFTSATAERLSRPKLPSSPRPASTTSESLSSAKKSPARFTTASAERLSKPIRPPAVQRAPSPPVATTSESLARFTASSAERLAKPVRPLPPLPFTPASGKDSSASIGIAQKPSISSNAGEIGRSAVPGSPSASTQATGASRRSTLAGCSVGSRVRKVGRPSSHLMQGTAASQARARKKAGPRPTGTNPAPKSPRKVAGASSSLMRDTAASGGQKLYSNRGDHPPAGVRESVRRKLEEDAGKPSEIDAGKENSLLLVDGSKETARRVGPTRREPQHSLAQSSDVFGKGLRGSYVPVRPKPSGKPPLTVPHAPKLATSKRHGAKPVSRQRAEVTTAQSCDSFGKGLRDDYSLAGSTCSSHVKSLTIPTAPHFATDDRCGKKTPAAREHGAEISLAQSDDVLRKGLRGGAPSTNLKRGPGLTVPKSPKFHKISHREPPKSTAEREKEIMDHYQSHPFKATPAAAASEGQQNGGARSHAKKSRSSRAPTTRRTTTTPKPFSFATDRRAARTAPRETNHSGDASGTMK